MRTRYAFAAAAWLLAASANAGTLLVETAFKGANPHGGPALTTTQFIGIRFELEERSQITAIGGTMGQPLDQPPSKLFGTISPLDGFRDFPCFDLLKCRDLLFTTVFHAPSPSGDVLAPIHVILDPGWYALWFGTFVPQQDSVSSAFIWVTNNTFGGPSFIIRRPDLGWEEFDPVPSRPELGPRILVEGFVVPEPTPLALIVVGVLGLVLRRHAALPSAESACE